MGLWMDSPNHDKNQKINISNRKLCALWNCLKNTSNKKILNLSFILTLL